MRLTKVKREWSSAYSMLMLALGGLLALGVELTILLLGSVAVSMGVLRMDASPQMTAVACLLGCFIGGRLTCAYWKTGRLIAGVLTGVACFLFILLAGLFAGKAEIGIQALIELFCCIVGGGLAGAFFSKRKKRGKKVR